MVQMVSMIGSSSCRVMSFCASWTASRNVSPSPIATVPHAMRASFTNERPFCCHDLTSYAGLIIESSTTTRSSDTIHPPVELFRRFAGPELISRNDEAALGAVLACFVVMHGQDDRALARLGLDNHSRSHVGSSQSFSPSHSPSSTPASLCSMISIALARWPSESGNLDAIASVMPSRNVTCHSSKSHLCASSASRSSSFVQSEYLRGFVNSMIPSIPISSWPMHSTSPLHLPCTPPNPR